MDNIHGCFHLCWPSKSYAISMAKAKVEPPNSSRQKKLLLTQNHLQSNPSAEKNVSPFIVLMS